MVELSLRTSSGPITEKHVSDFVTSAYGLEGTVRRLGGEKDDNFILTTERGESFLVKVAHLYEDPDVVSLQTSVLDYLERVAPELLIPRVVRDVDGLSDAPVSGGPLAGRRVRVTTYLEGTVLRNVESTSTLRHEIGTTAAQLDHALKSFDHVGLRRALLWDIGQAKELLPLLDELPATKERQLLEVQLERFVSEVLPRLSSLRSQAVHNDLSTDNLLVTHDGRSLTGILDFGDVVHTQLVNEVAIAASYQLSASHDPTNEAVEVVAGYHATSPLTDEELNLVPELIVGRVLLWVIIPRWRSAKLPQNDAYVLRNAQRSWSVLLRLLGVAHDDFVERLHVACGNGH
jgi:hydroxylysine kinase